MTEARRLQRSFGDGLIAETTGELWEDWMKHADRVLEDEQLVAAVYEALLRRNSLKRLGLYLMGCPLAFDGNRHRPTDSADEAH